MKLKAIALSYTLEKGGAARGFLTFTQRLPFEVEYINADAFGSFRYIWCIIFTSFFKFFVWALTAHEAKLSLSICSLRLSPSPNHKFLFLGWCANHIFSLRSSLKEFETVYIRASDEWWHLGLQHFNDEVIVGRTNWAAKVLAWLIRRD